MRAAWMCARAELRRNLRAWAALALIAGVFASVVVATAAGARRTHSALPRFLDAVDAADVFVGNALHEELQREIEHLPQVQAFGRVSFLLVAPKDAAGNVGTAAGITAIASVDGRWMFGFDRALLLAGRMPDAREPNEVLINEPFAETRNTRVGDELNLVGYGSDQLGAIFNGENVRPSGSDFRLKVVGIGRVPRDIAIGSDRAANAIIVMTPAFFARHGGSVANFGVNDILELKRGAADVPAFRRDAEEKFRTLRTPDDELVIDAVNDVLAPTRDALSTQGTALWLFVGVATLALLLVVGQAISRRVALSAVSAATLESLGMAGGARLVTVMIPVAVTAVLAAVLAAAGAALASGIFPIGFARLAEAQPGVRVDLPALAIGAAAVLVAIVIRIAPVAWVSVRSARAETVRPSRVTEMAARAGAGAASVAGIRMALEPGKGKAAVPVRAAIVSAVVGLTALTASFTIASSLQRVVDTPRLYGWNWDLAIAGPEDPSLVPRFVAPVASDPSVADHATVTLADVRINGRKTQGLEFASARGDLFLSLIDGRKPVGDAELVLGTESMRTLDVRIGDLVMVSDENETVTPVPMRVVGRAAFAGIDDDRLDDGVGFAEGALKRVFGGLGPDPGADDATDFVDILVRFKPGADVRARYEQLRGTIGETNVFLPSRPAAVDNLDRVSSVPVTLGALIVLMAIAALAHVLVTTSRRRARDISILKTLGFVRRQVRGVLAWQSATIAVIALTVGVPIGIAAGRWGWRVLADRLGVPVEIVTPATLVALALPATLLVVIALSALPARTAARTHPATVLRSE